MLVNTIFEDAVEKLFDVTRRFAAALEAAQIPYRVVGGLAVFAHVDAKDPMAARLTTEMSMLQSTARTWMRFAGHLNHTVSPSATMPGSICFWMQTTPKFAVPFISYLLAKKLSPMTLSQCPTHFPNNRPKGFGLPLSWTWCI